MVYQLIVQAVGGKSVQVPLRDYTHDLSAIADAVTPKPGSFFSPIRIIRPGRFFGAPNGKPFSTKLPKRSLLIVDEAYFEYVQDAGYPNSLDYQRDERRHFDAADLFQALRLGWLARRLRCWVAANYLDDAAGAPTVQRQRAGPVGGIGGVG